LRFENEKCARLPLVILRINIKFPDVIKKKIKKYVYEVILLSRPQNRLLKSLSFFASPQKGNELDKKL